MPQIFDLDEISYNLCTLEIFKQIIVLVHHAINADNFQSCHESSHVLHTVCSFVLTFDHAFTTLTETTGA
jgi:hypothetical protein